jgi:hypothetical protein
MVMELIEEFKFNSWFEFEFMKYHTVKGETLWLVKVCPKCFFLRLRQKPHTYTWEY